MRRKILHIAGTRPEAIKLAPVIDAVRAAGMDSRLVVTGQHRQLLDPMLDGVGLVADHDLDLMTPGQPVAMLAAGAIAGLDRVLAAEAPDLVIVQGDTATTLAGALAACWRKIPVGHVEAGLRSGDVAAPFPEEHHRKAVAALAALHFAPTEGARWNLLGEGVAEGAIHVTGNTAIDALHRTLRRVERMTKPVAERFGIDPARPLVLVTAHRRENWGEGMERLCRALRALIERHPVEILFPVHPGAAVRDTVRSRLGGTAHVHLVDPLPHDEFVAAARAASLMLSDSGGLQEEAPTIGTPLLVLRETTERPEALESGLVELVGTDEQRIAERADHWLARHGMRPVARSNPFGDGRAGERIAAAIAAYLDGRTALAEGALLRLA